MQSDEQFYTRADSITTGTRIQEFRDSVRARDQGCVITKTPNIYAKYNVWWGLVAAHIFPLAYEAQWSTLGLSNLMTILPTRGGSINSVENGILIRGDMHTSFDNYSFSINPDVSLLSIRKPQSTDTIYSSSRIILRLSFSLM